MDKLWIIERLRYPTKKAEVLQLVTLFTDMEVSPEEVMELSLHPNESIAFHSAWVLENMLLPHPTMLDYYLVDIISYLPKLQNESAKRHYTKLVAFGLGRVVDKKTAKVFEKSFWKENLDPLEELCFSWLFDEETKSGIKVHCLEILYLLSSRKTWIADELPGIIESKINFDPPAMRARGLEILRKLAKQKRRHYGL